MTVLVTLTGGGIDKYMRTHDSFIKNHDGTLDIVRGGARRRLSYAAGEWSEVAGNEKKKHRFFG